MVPCQYIYNTSWQWHIERFLNPSPLRSLPDPGLSIGIVMAQASYFLFKTFKSLLVCQHANRMRTRMTKHKGRSWSLQKWGVREGSMGQGNHTCHSPQENVESKLSPFSIMETASPMEVGKGVCEVWKTYTEGGKYILKSYFCPKLKLGMGWGVDADRKDRSSLHQINQVKIFDSVLLCWESRASLLHIFEEQIHYVSVTGWLCWYKSIFPGP